MSDRIAALDEVPADSSLLFRVRKSGTDADADAEDGDEDVEEVVLLGLDDGTSEVVAWVNRCQHFRHVRLDKGTGAPLRGDELVCANHGAMFGLEDGRCTFGPCEGAYLDGVAVTVEDGAVRLTDPDYEYVGRGPVDDDTDLASRSNREF